MEPAPRTNAAPGCGRWTRLRAEVRAPTPLPRDEGRWGQIRYGLAQPFLGLRTLFRSADLVGISLAPAVGVALVAGVIATSTGLERGVGSGLWAFVVAVAALAPVPPLLFGRVYMHLAAKSRPLLGLPVGQPYTRGLVQLVGEWLAQLLVLALGVLPLTLLLGALPRVGPALALSVQGAWALHWIVVEGYDGARTVAPGRTVAELEAVARRRPGSPWFQRAYGLVRPRWLWRLLAPVRMLIEVVTVLARPWRVEVDTVEREPWVSLGFGLGAAALLAVPGLNLLFRPAVVVGGVHLRAQLRLDEPEREPSGAVPPAGTQPYSVVR